MSRPADGHATCNVKILGSDEICGRLWLVPVHFETTPAISSGPTSSTSMASPVLGAPARIFFSVSSISNRLPYLMSAAENHDTKLSANGSGTIRLWGAEIAWAGCSSKTLKHSNRSSCQRRNTAAVERVQQHFACRCGGLQLAADHVQGSYQRSRSACTAHVLTRDARQVLPLLCHLQRHQQLLPLVLQAPYGVQALLLLLVLHQQGGQLVL